MLLLVASEHRSWILFYSIPVLKGILDSNYLEHYKLFVTAIWLLLQESISSIDIDTAEMLLQQFTSKFAVYYGI